jgi:hypothetical protein
MISSRRSAAMPGVAQFPLPLGSSCRDPRLVASGQQGADRDSRCRRCITTSASPDRASGSDHLLEYVWRLRRRNGCATSAHVELTTRAAATHARSRSRAPMRVNGARAAWTRQLLSHSGARRSTSCYPAAARRSSTLAHDRAAYYDDSCASTTSYRPTRTCCAAAAGPASTRGSRICPTMRTSGSRTPHASSARPRRRATTTGRGPRTSPSRGSPSRARSSAVYISTSTSRHRRCRGAPS